MTADAIQQRVAAGTLAATAIFCVSDYTRFRAPSRASSAPAVTCPAISPSSASTTCRWRNCAARRSPPSGVDRVAIGRLAVDRILGRLHDPEGAGAAHRRGRATDHPRQHARPIATPLSSCFRGGIASLAFGDRGPADLGAAGNGRSWVFDIYVNGIEVRIFIPQGAPNSADYPLQYAIAVEHTLSYLAEAGRRAKLRINGGVRQRGKFEAWYAGNAPLILGIHNGGGPFT